MARNNIERRQIFENAGIYLVISSEFCAGRAVEEVFDAAVAAGIRLIQLREKHADGGRLYELARRCRPIADRAGALLIIDDHVDVALAAGADGVHLGQDDLPAAAARRIAPELFIGVSTHKLSEAVAARDSGASYYNIGPIYPTGTKSLPMAPLGIGAISEISPRIDLPFSVMGGIKLRHIPELRAAGARVLAMVTEITAAPDVGAKCAELLTACGVKP